VVINGRDRAALEATREEIAANGAKVAAVAADVNTREGQDALLAACPEPDILINTMARRRAGIFASSTARPYSRRSSRTSILVRKPIPGLDVSSAARAGLTAFIDGPARELARCNVTVNNLLPGMFNTDRLRDSTRRMGGREEER
jgi:3-oxoacyl-[acyl-carrier protein] reductase